MTLKRSERVLLFLAALKADQPASSEEEALLQMERILKGVEDEHSGVPFNPNAANSSVDDGRMYSPHSNFAAEVPDRPEITAFKHRRGHVTYVRNNGAIRIELNGEPILDKAGKDGRLVF